MQNLDYDIVLIYECVIESLLFRDVITGANEEGMFVKVADWIRRVVRTHDGQAGQDPLYI